MHRFSLNVMAPLHIGSYEPGNLVRLGERNYISHIYRKKEDLDYFKNEIEKAANLHVDAVSVDIWWGMVKSRNHSYLRADWNYYEDIFKTIQFVSNNLGNGRTLKVVPIFSFHQCGGNVGDNFYMPIPLWVWDHVRDVAQEDLGIKLDILDVAYLNNSEIPSLEYVSLWADPYVKGLYAEFMEEFKQFISDINFLPSDIQELNISLGPSGEMRFPSYNTHDWGKYPFHGPMQCFGRLAERSWKNYCSEEGLTYNNTIDELAGNPNLFKKRLYMYDKRYHHLLKWYSKSLYEHGITILSQASECFNDAKWKTIPIGFKIPGIHWRLDATDDSDRNKDYLESKYYIGDFVSHKADCTEPRKTNCEEMYPRIPEITAGLISSDLYDDPNAPNVSDDFYKLKLEEFFDVLPNRNGGYVFHFTCLEKQDSNDDESHSIAQTLVDLVNRIVDDYSKRSNANKEKIALKGENALALTEKNAPILVNNIRTKKAFSGITILRISDFIREISKEYIKDSLERAIRDRENEQ
uniref:Beta-amylase n=1 Tax=Candidatus Kentrum eta TaxID=2126337 RepID=A0A450UBZ6_9GAMM|nr:MAG: Glycosyl hydrolase family 14 [Candidatus Kentron sp. H]